MDALLDSDSLFPILFLLLLILPLCMLTYIIVPLQLIFLPLRVLIVSLRVLIFPLRLLIFPLRLLTYVILHIPHLILYIPHLIFARLATIFSPTPAPRERPRSEWGWGRDRMTSSRIEVEWVDAHDFFRVREVDRGDRDDFRVDRDRNDFRIGDRDRDRNDFHVDRNRDHARRVHLAAPPPLPSSPPSSSYSRALSQNQSQGQNHSYYTRASVSGSGPGSGSSLQRSTAGQGQESVVTVSGGPHHPLGHRDHGRLPTLTPTTALQARASQSTTSTTTVVRGARDYAQVGASASGKKARRKDSESHRGDAGQPSPHSHSHSHSHSRSRVSEPISSPPRTSRQAPGVIKPLPFDPTPIRTSRRLRDSPAHIYFYRSQSERRINYPVQGGRDPQAQGSHDAQGTGDAQTSTFPDAQENDIYLNYVTSERLAQLWLFRSGTWTKVFAGHRLVIPPETEERYLVVTLGVQPSYVRRRTWMGAYKWGEEAYCPAMADW